MFQAMKRFKSTFPSVSARVRSRGRLKSRIMLLTAVCVALSTLAIGSISYLRIRTESQELAKARLATEALVLSQRFNLGYRMIANDLETISRTPPIQGIIRSQANGGIDPLDGSTLDLWRTRLETIFEAVLRGRPEYFQFRYIGTDDTGRELVRVDREGQGFTRVDAADLQQKGHEPYFAQGLSAPSGKVVFSAVTYNREHGAMESMKTPALRGMIPVNDENGRRFGFLAININYEKMLQSAFLDINPHLRTFVVNDAGDYMEHNLSSPRLSHRLELGTEPGQAVPEIIEKALNSRAEEALFYTADKVGYYVRDSGDFEQASANLGIVVEVPKKEWFATAIKTRNEFLAAGVVIVLVSVFFSVIMARSMMQPLADLAAVVRHSNPGDILENLPVNRPDEIGALAAAIKIGNARLIESRNAELNESRARAAAIVNNVIDGLILIDENGLIEQFNPSCERMFGYAASEVIGANVTLLMKPEDAKPHASYLTRYKEGRGGAIIDRIRELEAVDRNGRVFPIELAINAVTVDGAPKFSGVIRDISERRAIDRLRREFVSTVSHELRTPLTSIRGSLTLIDALAAPDLPPKVQRLLTMAQKNTERLILLVNDILDFEKLRANKTQYKFTKVDLNEELRKALDLNQGYAHNSGIELTSDLPPGQIWVWLDPDKLQQILGNLISNAVKFSLEDGSVTIRAKAGSTTIRVEVQDRGQGIPEDFRERIFEPFSQADGSATRRKGGSGLGLHITRRLVDGMKGKIGFESEDGQGTTFWLEFPAYDTVTADADISALVSHSSERILGLHLEDDADFHLVLATAMDRDMDLIHARTINEARQLLGKYVFDIVIVDRMLKDGEGLEILDHLQQREETKIVVLTAVDETIDHPLVDETVVKSKTRPGEVVNLFADLIDEVKLKKIRKLNAA